MCAGASVSADVGRVSVVEADYRYETIPLPAHCIQWRGNNYRELVQFLMRFVGSPSSIGLQHSSGGMVRFRAWGDDQVVEPGDWVLVDERDPDDNSMIIDNDAFVNCMRKAVDDGRA